MVVWILIFDAIFQQLSPSTILFPRSVPTLLVPPPTTDGILISLACCCHLSPWSKGRPPPSLWNFHSTILWPSSPPLQTFAVVTALVTFPFIFMLYGSLILNLWRTKQISKLCKCLNRFTLENEIKIDRTVVYIVDIWVKLERKSKGFWDEIK